MLKRVVQNSTLDIHREIALRWTPQKHLWEVSIGSDDDLVPSGKTPLPKSMLT